MEILTALINLVSRLFKQLFFSTNCSDCWWRRKRIYSTLCFANMMACFIL